MDGEVARLDKYIKELESFKKAQAARKETVEDIDVLSELLSEAPKVTPKPIPITSKPHEITSISEALKKAFAMSPIIHLDPTSTSKTFGVDWKTSQLYSLLHDLGLLEVLDRGDAFVAGGSLIRHLLKMDIFQGDIDVYAGDNGRIDEVISLFSKQPTWTKSKFAYNFTHSVGMRKIRIQVIHHQPAPFDKALNSYDFETCKIGYRCKVFTCSPFALALIGQKKLEVSETQGLKNIPYSMQRALKYKRNGFDVDEALQTLVQKLMTSEMTPEELERYDAGDYA